MTGAEGESLHAVSIEKRSVVNFSKHLVENADGGLQIRVLTCWIHISKSSSLGSGDNRVLILGFPEDPKRQWSLSDQYRFNKEFWENGSASFGVGVESLYPIDVSLWTNLAMFAEDVLVTVYNSKIQIGSMDGQPLYEVLNLNGRAAIYQGKTRGTEEASDRDLLIPSTDGWFLHYKIVEATVSDWMTISTKGESATCKEALLELAVRSSL